ncbi:DUF1934 domain-containing protein [Fervidicella metallireducens]|uniref:DUF1934 domain-containing protein n=1 Tax=Fervidicella metallireducens TaxID=655338 RepID=UPI0006854B56|nr:DUF1934 domain-containing protein [Fervidicella metallireducens]
MKIKEDALTILRQGTTNSELYFKKGIEHVSFYSTPYGALEVKVSPDKVHIDVNENGGRVELKYKMEAIGLYPIENSLELNIKHLDN